MLKKCVKQLGGTLVDEFDESGLYPSELSSFENFVCSRQTPLKQTFHFVCRNNIAYACQPT